MKVCMVTSSYPRYAGDGVGSFVRSLAQALVALGHTVHVVAPYDPAIEEMDQGGVCVHRFRYAPSDALCLVGHGRSMRADVHLRPIVPLLMPAFILAATVCTLTLHGHERFDLIHGHWAVPGGAIAGLVARLASLPLVISLHGSDVYVAEQNRLYASVARCGFRRATHVIACSEDLRARAVRIGLEGEKSSVIPYGVDVGHYATGRGSRMRARLGVPADALVIGALGRLVNKKGFGYLLEAMPAVLGSMRDVYCVIGGGGDLRDDLIAQASRLGVSSHVLLPGHVDWRDTPDYYAMCDVVAVPSVIDADGNVDGLPNVLLEAMASGRAVVASEVGGMPDVIVNGVDGLLVPPGDGEALRSTLLRLLGDPSFRRKLGAMARDRVIRGYQWSVVADRMASLYECAVKESSRQR